MTEARAVAEQLYKELRTDSPIDAVTRLTAFYAQAQRETYIACEQRLEEQRQAILGNKNDPSWTGHLAEVQSWCRQNAAQGVNNNASSDDDSKNP